MKEIPLSGGSTALIDDEDYSYLSRWKWHNGGGYAVRTEYETIMVTHQGKRRKVFIPQRIIMAREIMRAPSGRKVIHLNGDNLDNSRANLALAGNGDIKHRRGKQAGCSSKYKGVIYQKNVGKWRARITIDGKLTCLGLYDTEKEAALAYNEAAKKHYGELARLNEVRA